MVVLPDRCVLMKWFFCFQVRSTCYTIWVLRSFIKFTQFRSLFGSCSCCNFLGSMLKEDPDVIFFLYFSTLSRMFFTFLVVQRPCSTFLCSLLRHFQPLLVILSSFHIFPFFVNAKNLYCLNGHFFLWFLGAIVENKVFSKVILVKMC